MSKRMLSADDVKRYNAQVDMAKSIYPMMKQLAETVIQGAKKTNKVLASEAQEVFQSILDYKVDDLNNLKPEDVYQISRLYSNAFNVFSKLSADSNNDSKGGKE